jgi:hypothetical protein
MSIALPIKLEQFSLIPRNTRFTLMTHFTPFESKSLIVATSQLLFSWGLWIGESVWVARIAKHNIELKNKGPTPIAWNPEFGVGPYMRCIILRVVAV